MVAAVITSQHSYIVQGVPEMLKMQCSLCAILYCDTVPDALFTVFTFSNKSCRELNIIKVTLWVFCFYNMKLSYMDYIRRIKCFNEQCVCLMHSNVYDSTALPLASGIALMLAAHKRELKG